MSLMSLLLLAAGAVFSVAAGLSKPGTDFRPLPGTNPGSTATRGTDDQLLPASHGTFPPAYAHGSGVSDDGKECLLERTDVESERA